MAQQQLFPPGYEDYNDLVKIASSPVRPIQRLKKVYYQFDLEEVNSLLEKVKIENEKNNFLLASELELLEKIIFVMTHLKDQKRIHLITMRDAEDLINLSFNATFERVVHILETVINKTIGKTSTIIEDKIIFSIRSNLRLLGILMNEDKEIYDRHKYERILTNFKVILRNIISINASIMLTQEESNALLEDIISETTEIWINYKKLTDFTAPAAASTVA